MANPQTEPIVNLLKDHHIRITPQRVAIMKTIKELAHPTAEQIHAQLIDDYTNMSFATVYNTLRSLKEVGLVREIRCGEGCTRFEALEKKHYHLICKNCGRIDDIVFDPVINIPELEGKSGFTLSDHNIELYGLCPECKTE